MSDLLEQPPRAGAGSSTEVWQEYARAIGLDGADELGRDDIIELVDSLDTGFFADVDEDERQDADEGEGANALEGGADDDLADVYANPEGEA